MKKETYYDLLFLKLLRLRKNQKSNFYKRVKFYHDQFYIKNKYSFDIFINKA